VWEFEIPLFDKPRKGGHGPEAWGNQVFCALRLANGNTLIATGNGHSVLEVSPDKTIVWQLHQDDLPNIRLAWVTTLEVLPNGHYVIGNCHAGAGQPMLVQIEPKTKTVVWTFEQFERFGNSMSNSQLLDVGPDVIR
jgi:outer membrane protein assembly factor BamB